MNQATEWFPRPELAAASDGPGIEELYDMVFGPGRFGLSSYRLRQGCSPVPELGLVVRDQVGVLVGALRFWPVRIGEPGWPALLAGPLGVHPTRQGEGIGAALVYDGLQRAAATAMSADAGEAGCWRRVIIVGDEPYYRRFGFSRALAAGVRFPPPTDPARVLAVELEPAAMRDVAGDVGPWHSAGNGE